ncbi:MAG: hypothetical protein WBV69_24600 [Candidatus Sulfotelmatobacter sp.]
MSRFNVCVAVLLMTAAAVFAPSRAAAITDDVELVIAGSSALWQTAGLAAFQDNGTLNANGGENGVCAALGVTTTAPCQHYTNNSSFKFNLNDSRPTTLGGATNVDTGNLWIVWDSGTSTRHIWVYINVDSVVGDRCFFAQPHCTITVPSGYNWSTVGNIVDTHLWGPDVQPPADVEALFGPGVTVNTGATDIRPDDAQFVICRVDSLVGHGTETASAPDNLDGLGYASNPIGTCPTFSTISLSTGVGNPIKSGFSSSTANPLAFNIGGHDPFTNTTIPASYVVNFGADPIVFIYSRTATANNGLTGLSAGGDASDAELQDLFSGTTCNATVFGQPSAPINAFLREPLSGTMNTTEASVFRRPVDTVHKKVLGKSQELNVGSTNPLSDTACAGGGGARSRAIGTGQMVGTAVKNAGSGAGGTGENGNDGVGYTFFSFGNVSPIAGSAEYGYLTLDGEDPIGLGTANQELPTCTYPCPEAGFGPWLSGTTLQSFPALRAGHYSAWSLLRMVTASAHETLVEDLAKASFKYVVNDTPDYIPNTATTDANGNTDAGLVIFHSHYQQRNAAGATLGVAPTNGAFNGTTHNPDLVGGDHGGDMGGCTITTTGISAATKKNYIQASVNDPFGPPYLPATGCILDRN